MEEIKMNSSKITSKGMPKIKTGNMSQMKEGYCEDSYVSRYSGKAQAMTKAADHTVMQSGKTRKDPTMALINSMTSSKR